MPSGLPAHLEQLVRQRMAAAFEEFPQSRKHLEEADGLEIWGTIGAGAYLRPDGSVWIYHDSRTQDQEQWEWREATAQEAAGIIKSASKRIPELSALLPPRGQEQPSCPRCAGTGQLTRNGTVVAAGVWCDACHGVGYMVPGAA